MSTKIISLLLFILVQTAIVFSQDFPPNPIEKEGWKLVFNDEFSGSELDTSKWISGYFPGRFGGTYENPVSKAYYEFREDHESDVLVLQIPVDKATGVAGTSAISTYNTYNWHKTYANENIPTVNKFTQLYGYYEVRSRHPVAKTARHAAWWILEAKEHGKEIDIHEDGSYGGPNFHMGTSYPCDPCGKTGSAVDYYGIYGMEIHEGGIRFYKNNQLVHARVIDWTSIGEIPFGHILSMYADQHHNSTTHEFMIDYFRAYKRPGSVSTALPSRNFTLKANKVVDVKTFISMPEVFPTNKVISPLGRLKKTDYSTWGDHSIKRMGTIIHNME